MSLQLGSPWDLRSLIKMQIPKGSAWAGPGTIICRAQWIDASDP